jgi:hypothetical protein
MKFNAEEIQEDQVTEEWARKFLEDTYEKGFPPPVLVLAKKSGTVL